jgi:uncharacterized protein (TIGR03663 family)
MWALLTQTGISQAPGLGGRHGPLPHLLHVFAFHLFGDSDFALRFFAALFGVGLLALLYPFRERLSPLGTLGATFLLGFSPLMVYYSRFAIHEIFLVFFTLLMALALYSWIWKRNKNYFLLVAAAGALMVVTKETWVINLTALLAALTLTVYLHRQELLPFKIRSWLNPKIFTLGVMLLFLLITVTYTRFFTRLQDLIYLREELLYWAGRGVRGEDHSFPFLTYIINLYPWELSILSLAVLSILLWFKFRDPLGTYLVFWAFFTLLAYSIIEYKTPWLTINILLPWGLLAGRSLKYLSDYPLKTKILLPLMVFLLVGSFSFSLAKTIELNYYRYDGSNLWLVYSQEPRFIKKLYHQIFQVAGAQDNPQEVKIDLVLGPAEKSPALWYLRRFPGKILYEDILNLPQSDMVLFSDTTKAQVVSQLKTEDYEKGRISSYPGVILHIWVKKEAWEQFKNKNLARKD